MLPIPLSLSPHMTSLHMQAIVAHLPRRNLKNWKIAPISFPLYIPCYNVGERKLKLLHVTNTNICRGPR